jgi:hypothetical protein
LPSCPAVMMLFSTDRVPNWTEGNLDVILSPYVPLFTYGRVLKKEILLLN